MNTRACAVLIAIIGVLARPGFAVGVSDPRFQQISAQELVSAVRATPAESEANVTLLSRAGTSGIAQTAFHLFKDKSLASPKNPYLMLWYGMAALSYFNSVLGPHARTAPVTGSASPRAANKALGEAEVALQTAAKLLPKSATANVEYGFFLWQYKQQLAAGLEMMRAAASLAPDDPRVHAYLGNVYCNPTGGALDTDRAESELKLASKIDPAYAYPHWRLAGLYVQLNRMDAAKSETESYRTLVPSTLQASGTSK